MSSHIPIWISVVASAAQGSLYSTISNATEQSMIRLMLETTNATTIPTADESLFLEMVTKSDLFGVGLGFCLSWPVANTLGRRRGLLWSNLLPLLAILFGWVGFLGLTSSTFQLALVCASSRACSGATIGLPLALHLLYIFEVYSTERGRRRRRRSRAASAVVSYFVVSVVTCCICLRVLRPLAHHHFEENGIDETPWLLSYALIPAGIQMGALLCSVEPVPGGGGGGGDDEGVVVRVPKKVTFLLVVISLTFAGCSGPYHAHRSLSRILEESPTFPQLDSSITSLSPALNVFALLLLLWLTTTQLTPVRTLMFGNFAGLFVSALLRVLVVLVALFFDPRLEARFWSAVAWTVYSLDKLSGPAAVTLIVLLLILLMELGGQQQRGKRMAESLIRPFILCFCILLVGGLILHFTGILEGLVSQLTTRLSADASPFSLFLASSAALALNIGLSFGVTHVWSWLEEEEDDGASSGRRSNHNPNPSQLVKYESFVH